MIKTTLKKALLIALAIIPMTFFGQRQENPSNYWFIGLEGGGTMLFADNQPWKFDQLSWDADLQLGFVMNSSFYLYGNAGVVRLKGKYENFWKLEECKAISADLNVGYDVLQLFNFNPHRLVAIVPHLGWGLIEHRSTIKYEDGTEVKTGYQDNNNGTGIGGRRNVMEIPMGVNFVFNFTKHFQANIDFVTYYTSTDWLDARGGAPSKYDDWYSKANIGVAYKFGNKEQLPCPECEDCSQKAGDCNSCADAVKQAVKDAIDEAEAEKAAKEAAEAAAAAEQENADEAEGLENYEEKDIHLTFEAGKAEVKNTMANDDEAKKVKEDIDNGREISKIKTVGYASPEGNAEQNEQLAADRAQATSDFIQNKLGEDAEGIEFSAEGKGSDWDGFFKALEESDIKAKDEIRKQIRNSEDPTGTLNEMRAKYPELNSILETLRVTRVYINK